MACFIGLFNCKAEGLLHYLHSNKINAIWPVFTAKTAHGTAVFNTLSQAKSSTTNPPDFVRTFPMARSKQKFAGQNWKRVSIKWGACAWLTSSAMLTARQTCRRAPRKFFNQPDCRFPVNNKPISASQMT